MKDNGQANGVHSTIGKFTGIDTGNPMDQIRYLFKTGQWLNTYELPFFQPTYLQANTYQHWQTGNLQSAAGQSTLTEFAKASLKIDFPTQPSFTFTDVNNSGYDSGGLTVSFYLINKTDEWLEKNFRFLHAFFGGTQWVQYQFGFIKGPNVYNVLVPGRFNILWAAVGSTITCEGELRKNRWMAEKFGKGATQIAPGHRLKSIDFDTLWPAAWKVDIQIKDLTPNNFNTYIDYFKNGHESNFELIRTSSESDDWSKWGAHGNIKHKSAAAVKKYAKDANLDSAALSAYTRKIENLYNAESLTSRQSDADTNLTGQLAERAQKAAEAKAQGKDVDVSYLKSLKATEIKTAKETQDQIAGAEEAARKARNKFDRFTSSSRKEVKLSDAEAAEEAKKEAAGLSYTTSKHVGIYDRKKDTIDYGVLEQHYKDGLRFNANTGQFYLTEQEKRDLKGMGYSAEEIAALDNNIKTSRDVNDARNKLGSSLIERGKSLGLAANEAEARVKNLKDSVEEANNNVASIDALIGG